MKNGFSSWVRFVTSEKLDKSEFEDKRKYFVEEENRDFFIDWGEEIPTYYNKNYLRLLVQDPYRIFAYWELDIETVSKYFKGTDNRLILKVFNLTDGFDIPIDVGNSTNWWIHTSPNREYRVKLFVRKENGEEDLIMVSNSVKTPRDSVCWKVNEYDVFSRENLKFFEMLTLSGAKPVNWDFLEKLKNYPWDEPLFKIPEVLLKFLPLWLRTLLRQLNLTLPLSFFIEYILKVYFPEQLHSLILRGENLTIQDLERYIKIESFSSSDFNIEKGDLQQK